VLVVGADNLSATGASDFLETAERVRQHLNPDLQRFGIVVNNVARRSRTRDGSTATARRSAPTCWRSSHSATRSRSHRTTPPPSSSFAGAPQDARTCYREIGVAVLQRLGIEGRARAPFRPEPEEPSTAPSVPAVAPATRTARRRSAQSPAATELVAARPPTSPTSTSPASTGRAGQGGSQSQTRTQRMLHKSSDDIRASNDEVENHG
jgi:hypothetical protein